MTKIQKKIKVITVYVFNKIPIIKLIFQNSANYKNWYLYSGNLPYLLFF